MQCSLSSACHFLHQIDLMLHSTTLLIYIHALWDIWVNFAHWNNFPAFIVFSLMDGRSKIQTGKSTWMLCTNLSLTFVIYESLHISTRHLWGREAWETYQVFAKVLSVILCGDDTMWMNDMRERWSSEFVVRLQIIIIGPGDTYYAVYVTNE